MGRGHKKAKTNPPNPPVPPPVNRVRRFNLFRVFGYLGIVVVAGGLTLWNHSRLMWTPIATPGGARAHALQLARCGVILLLAIRWVIATHREFKLWTDVLKNPMEKSQTYVAITALSLGLGASLAFSFDIVWLSFTFTIFLLANYWSQWLANEYFDRALRKTRESTDDSARTAVLDVMKHYWLQRAQLARITTMMFFSAMAFSMALAGHFDKVPRRDWFQLGANSVLILNIIIGEIVIGVWRFKRNKNIALALAPNSTWRWKRKPDERASPADEGDLRSLKGNAYVLIYGVAIGLNIVNYVKSLVPSVPSNWNNQAWLYVASILLFVQCLALSVLWIRATKKELKLWIKYLINPVDKAEVTLAIIGLGLALGILLSYSYAIVFISFFVTLYFLLNYWTQWLSNDHFSRALERTWAAAPKAAKKRVLNVLEEYWLLRPQMARITTLMFFSAMAFSLALAGWVQNEPQRSRFYLRSYTLLILDILIGEIVIFVWRRHRDHNLDAIEAK